MVADTYPEVTSAFWNTYYEYLMPDILSMPDIVNITQPTNGFTGSGKITITLSYPYGKNVYVQGNASNLKDSAIYTYNSHVKFEINATSSKYGIISSHSEIYIVGNVPVALYYYHIYNSTVYLGNWLHIEVLDS